VQNVYQVRQFQEKKEMMLYVAGALFTWAFVHTIGVKKPVAWTTVFWAMVLWPVFWGAYLADAEMEKGGKHE
jgi:hypothetical protein